MARHRSGDDEEEYDDDFHEPESRKKAGGNTGIIIALVACGCLGFGAVIMVIGAAVALPGLSNAKMRADQINSMNNLKQIAISVQMFETHKGLPPRNLQELIESDILMDSESFRIPNESGNRYTFIPYKRSDRSDRVILVEPAGSWPDRIHVGFRDGSVRSIKGDMARQREIEAKAMAGQPVE